MQSLDWFFFKKKYSILHRNEVGNELNAKQAESKDKPFLSFMDV